PPPRPPLFPYTTLFRSQALPVFIPLYLLKRRRLMKRIKTHILRRCFAFLMAAIVLAGTAITSPMTAHAADGTLNFQTGELISYGDYYTTKMSVDNNGTAYCVQPMKRTPAAGSYRSEERRVGHEGRSRRGRENLTRRRG